MTELDLDKGSDSAADKILSEGQAARAGRKQTRSTASSKSKTGKALIEAEERSLHQRCIDTFNDFVEQFKERDPELSDILERRKDAMAQGLVGLTRTVKILRTPLVLMLGFLQPTMAFWELGGLLVGRYIARRQRRAYEQQTEEVTGVPINEPDGQAIYTGFAN